MENGNAWKSWSMLVNMSSLFIILVFCCCDLLLRDCFHFFSHPPATFSFIQKLIVWFDSHIFRRQCKHAGGGFGHAAADRLSRGSSELCRIPSGPRSRSKCRLQPWLAPTCHSCCCWVWTHWVLKRRVWISGIFILVSLLLLKWFSHFHFTQTQ